MAEAFAEGLPAEGGVGEVFAEVAAFPALIHFGHGFVSGGDVGPDDGGGLKGDFVAFAEDEVGEGAVFGDGGGLAAPGLVVPVVQDGFDGGAAIGGEGAGGAEDRTYLALVSAGEVEGEDEAGAHHAGEDASGTVEDFDVAGDGADAGVTGDGGDEAAEGVALDDGIGIHRHQYIAGGEREADPQALPLAAVFIHANCADAIGMAFGGGFHVEPSVVFGAVIDGDDLHFFAGVVGAGDGVDGLADVGAFVVGGDDDGDGGEVGIGEGGHGAVGHDHNGADEGDHEHEDGIAATEEHEEGADAGVEDFGEGVEEGAGGVSGVNDERVEAEQGGLEEDVVPREIEQLGQAGADDSETDWDIQLGHLRSSHGNHWRRVTFPVPRTTVESV